MMTKESLERMERFFANQQEPLRLEVRQPSDEWYHQNGYVQLPYSKSWAKPVTIKIVER